MSFQPTPTPTPGDGGGNSDERMWAMFAHLAPVVGFGIIGALVIWLIKKEESAFVADQAKEALNFQLSTLIAVLICGVTLVGVILWPVIGVGSLIMGVMAGVEANKGVYYRYPYNFRMIE